MIKYIVFLALYRMMYAINYMYRYQTEDHYSDPISWIAGGVQLILYLDVLYHAFKNDIFRQESTPRISDGIRYSVVPDYESEDLHHDDAI